MQLTLDQAVTEIELVTLEVRNALRPEDPVDMQHIWDNYDWEDMCMLFLEDLDAAEMVVAGRLKSTPYSLAMVEVFRKHGYL